MSTPIDRGRSALRARQGRGDETLYARATPEKVEVTENYSVTQVISKNPQRAKGRPTGRIEITIPYDGSVYFTRQAAEDVERAISGDPDSTERAVVTGHLLLAEHDKAELPAEVRLRGEVGVIPIAVPVSPADVSGGMLTDDRHACVITHDYEPQNPPIIPAGVEIALYDPDTALDLVSLIDDQVRKDKGYYAKVFRELRQKAAFQSELLMTMVVRLSLPASTVQRGGQYLPVVKRVSIAWPTITSLRTIELDILGVEDKEKPAVRYNPVERQLEWGGVKMIPSVTSRDGGRARTDDYESRLMLLWIGHPGELYRAPNLKVRAEIEIPGYLISGLEPRLFGATGREQVWKPGHPTKSITQARQPITTRTTQVNIDGTLVLDDAFAKRKFMPYHHIVFDDIIPDDMRISDIRAVLRNLRFEIETEQVLDENPDAPQWFLSAARSQGPDRMELWISVEGTRQLLDREQIMGNTVVRISGKKTSGQIKLYVLGILPRDHQELTREMNALQQALRDRYRFHQTSRR